MMVDWELIWSAQACLRFSTPRLASGEREASFPKAKHLYGRHSITLLKYLQYLKRKKSGSKLPENKAQASLRTPKRTPYN
jgi:hypothetical protein